LREALLRHEESQRLHRMCRELKGKAALAGVLKKSHSRALEAYTSAEEEDNFQELLDPPHILGINIVLCTVLLSQKSTQKKISVHMSNRKYQLSCVKCIMPLLCLRTKP
jgi:hypothetical protein